MDYFIQNGGKKKRTKTESNSLKSKKSGGNFLGNLENLKGKKAKDTIKKGGACTLMDKRERESRGMAALMSPNEELVDSLLVEEEFRKICVSKQNEYRTFESDISRLIQNHYRKLRTELPEKDKEQLKETWANGANEDMKRKLNDFIIKKPNWRSSSFLTNFKTNILDDERLKLCYTEKVKESLTNQPYNFRTTTNMYVRFNNIFETKTKLNSLLKKNNSRKKNETSSDMFKRLLAQASSQGSVTQFLNSNNNNEGSRGGPAFNSSSSATNRGPAKKNS